MAKKKENKEKPVCSYCGREVKGNVRQDAEIICSYCALRRVAWLQKTEKKLKLEIKTKKELEEIEKKQGEED